MAASCAREPRNRGTRADNVASSSRGSVSSEHDPFENGFYF